MVVWLFHCVQFAGWLPWTEAAVMLTDACRRSNGVKPSVNVNSTKRMVTWLLQSVQFTGWLPWIEAAVMSTDACRRSNGVKPSVNVNSTTTQDDPAGMQHEQRPHQCAQQWFSVQLPQQ
jgi:hypothetical protein